MYLLKSLSGGLMSNARAKPLARQMGKAFGRGDEAAALAPVRGHVGSQYDRVSRIMAERNNMLRTFSPPPVAPPPGSSLAERAKHSLASKQLAWAKADADRLAMSGRHGGTQILKPSPSAIEQPAYAYRGITGGSHFVPEMRASKGAPVWWTPHSDIAAGYANPARPSYIVGSPVSRLRQAGPASPGFHPHLAKDTRGMTPDQVKALPKYDATNVEWASRPNYEGVFTSAGGVLPKDKFGHLFKSLPSGRAYQRVM